MIKRSVKMMLTLIWNPGILETFLKGNPKFNNESDFSDDSF